MGIPSGAGTGTGRSVYRISVTASDTEQATRVITRIFCPDPDHAPPCPVPWESMSSTVTGSVEFVLQDVPEH